MDINYATSYSLGMINNSKRKNNLCSMCALFVLLLLAVITWYYDGDFRLHSAYVFNVYITLGMYFKTFPLFNAYFVWCLLYMKWRITKVVSSCDDTISNNNTYFRNKEFPDPLKPNGHEVCRTKIIKVTFYSNCYKVLVEFNMSHLNFLKSCWPE